MNSGTPDFLSNVNQKVANILSTHQPIPLSEEMERELDQIYKRAKDI
jgi:ACT domain-containing protein